MNACGREGPWRATPWSIVGASRLARWLVPLAAALAACGSDDSSGGGPAACEGDACASAPPCLDPNATGCGAPAGWTACPDGFAALDGEPGCAPKIAAMCAPGTMAGIGGACTPVGARCSDGFVADRWGCKPVLPPGACTGATRAALGSTSCVPIGACASGPPADADTFVDAAFTAGQLDATHVRTIGEALASPTAKVIAVAPGTYAERLTVARSGVHLVGRCAAQVIVDGLSQPQPKDAVLVDGATDVRIEGVTLRGNLVGVRVRSGGSATLAASLVEKSAIGGVQVEGNGSRLEVTASALKDGLGGSILAGTGGVGATAGTGGALTIEDSSIERALGIGVDAESNGSVSLARVAIVDTKEDSTGAYGMAAFARGAKIDATSIAIAGAHELGFACMGAGSTCSLDKSTVADVAMSSAAGRGFGRAVEALGGQMKVTDTTFARIAQSALWAESSGSIDAANVTTHECGGRGADVEQSPVLIAIAGGKMKVASSALVSSYAGGMVAYDRGSTLEAAGVLVDGVATNGKDSAGHGVDVQNGAHATLANVVLSRATETGVYVEGKGTVATIDHALVNDTAPNGAGAYGFGVTVGSGGALTMSASAVLRNVTMGVIVTDAGSTAKLSQLVVASTLPQKSDGKFGRGLQVQQGAQVTLDEGALFDDTEVAAAVVHPGSSLDLAHALLTRTRVNAASNAGRGLIVQAGARAAVASSAVLSSTQLGVSAGDEGSDLTVDHCVVSGTKKDAGGLLGHGILGLAGTLIHVSSTRVESSEAAALAFDGPAASIAGSQIERNAVGLFVADGTSLEETAAAADAAPGSVLVSKDTTFVGNQVRVSGGALPLPDPLDAEAGRPKHAAPKK